MIAIEDRAHGINHARAGAELARAWLLPEELAVAIERHHDYAALADGSAGVAPAVRAKIALALAAEAIYVKQTMGVASAEWRAGGEFALAALAITQEALDAVAAELARG